MECFYRFSGVIDKALRVKLPDAALPARKLRADGNGHVMRVIFTGCEPAAGCLVIFRRDAHNFPILSLGYNGHGVQRGGVPVKFHLERKIHEVRAVVIERLHGGSAGEIEHGFAGADHVVDVIGIVDCDLGQRNSRRIVYKHPAVRCNGGIAAFYYRINVVVGIVIQGILVQTGIQRPAAHRVCSRAAQRCAVVIYRNRAVRQRGTRNRDGRERGFLRQVQIGLAHGQAGCADRLERAICKGKIRVDAAVACRCPRGAIDNYRACALSAQQNVERGRAGIRRRPAVQEYAAGKGLDPFRQVDAHALRRAAVRVAEGVVRPQIELRALRGGLRADGKAGAVRIRADERVQIQGRNIDIRQAADPSCLDHDPADPDMLHPQIIQHIQIRHARQHAVLFQKDHGIAARLHGFALHARTSVHAFQQCAVLPEYQQARLIGIHGADAEPAVFQ